MQRLVIVLVLVLGIAPAFAQETEAPRKLDSLSQREREREILAQQWQGPSGFWTSPYKAKNGAYRYRLMGIGGVLLIGMSYLTYRLIKKANDDRNNRPPE
jgi:hypothetical protein